MANLDPQNYHIGILCALKFEQAAMLAMLDEPYGIIQETRSQDHNVYFAGRIHDHRVVIACLPASRDGLAAAAITAKDMTRTFTQLRYGLLVGIGGGIPNLENGVDIRLGDVVVSQPQATNGGVIQYDKGKHEHGGQWTRRGTLNSPPTSLLNALHALQTVHELENSKINSYLSQMLDKRTNQKVMSFAEPSAAKDVLHSSPDNSDMSSEDTDSSTLTPPVPIRRAQRPTEGPQIHYGTIVSGNAEVTDAMFRDRLRREHNALCVEREAAGLMNDFPCLVIRGICDYADKYKNDDWHRYAAATAAAFAKELLLYVSTHSTSRERPVQQIPQIQADTMEPHLRQSERHNVRQEARRQQIEAQHEDARFRDGHQTFQINDHEGIENVINPPSFRGVYRLVLERQQHRDR